MFFCRDVTCIYDLNIALFALIIYFFAVVYLHFGLYVA